MSRESHISEKDEALIEKLREEGLYGEAGALYSAASGIPALKLELRRSTAEEEILGAIGPNRMNLFAWEYLRKWILSDMTHSSNKANLHFAFRMDAPWVDEFKHLKSEDELWRWLDDGLAQQYIYEGPLENAVEELMGDNTSMSAKRARRVLQDDFDEFDFDDKTWFAQPVEDGY